MSNKSWSISRRSMLRGIGAMIALPQLEIMAKTTEGIAGMSSVTQAPMRFMTFFLPNGVMPSDWDVKGEGKDYKISPILSPLDGFREDFNIISGLDNTANGHVAMTSAFLTGVNLAKDGTAAQSLDQQIAAQIGDSTRFPSLVLGTEPPRQGKATGHAISVASTVSWSSPTARIAPEINPQVAFDRLFRSGSGPNAIREAEMRKSVIDLVLDDAKQLQRKASRLDKDKLEEYLESIRSVERRLEKTINPVKADWEPPTTPTDADFFRPEAGIPRERDKHLRMMLDIMILGFWTDTTRVGTLMAAHGFSRQNFSFLDGVSGDHHGISHHKNQSKSTEQYSKVSTWYTEQLAYLMGRLKGINEGESNLLDNSVIFYGSGMKDGNGHVKKNLPVVLAGGGRGTIKPKGHIKLPNQPLSNLHYTIAQKFGIEAEDFNNTGSKNIQELV